MKEQNFKVIKTFTDLTEAKVAKSKLDALGINSWLDT